MSTLLLSKIPVKLSQKINNIRGFSLQEHVALTILNQHKIKTPRFGIAKTPNEADKIARDLLTKNLMVKAQVMADGRDTGHFSSNCFKGGVHSAISPQEVKEISEKMLGQHFITADTNSTGLICNSVLVSERKFPRRNFKFAITLDPQFNGPVVTASMAPNVNCTIPIKADVGLTKQMANWIARKVGICSTNQPSETENMLCHLYKLFMCKELLNIEINPWIEDVCSNYYATDVKIEVDDSSKFKNDEIFRKLDESQIDEREIEATKLGMKFIGYENGTIGCISNGAGLAMATNDIIKFYGGKPANFMDIGGSVTVDSVKKAVEIVMKDKNVTTLFVNIFGGLLSCNIVVEGLIKVMKENDSKIPCVVCFKGLKAEEAMQFIKKGDSSLIVRKDLGQATQMAIRCSEIMKTASEGDLHAFLKMKMICDCDPIPTNSKSPEKSSKC